MFINIALISKGLHIYLFSCFGVIPFAMSKVFFIGKGVIGSQNKTETRLCHVSVETLAVPQETSGWCHYSIYCFTV